MDSESILKYMLVLILLSGFIHCDPRQNDGTLYTLYNNRRGENTVIRVQPDRKIEPAYGYPSSDQEALYRYQLYNGGLTQIDYPQPDDAVYVFRKDLTGQPVIPAQPVSLQQQAGPASVNEAPASIAQLQQQKQLQQSQQQLQQTQQQLALQNQQKQREQQVALQGGSQQQTPHPQQPIANPLPTAVYGILIKQDPNQVSTSKGREEKSNSSPLLRPESRIVAQTIPQQQQGAANNVRNIPSGLGTSNGLPVLPPIFGVHNGVLGKLPLPFPNIPAYSISQYRSTPQKQGSIGDEYLNAQSPAPQKKANENLSLRAPHTQINAGAQLPPRDTSDKQLPIRNLGVTRTQLSPQAQTVYFDDEKEHKLAPSVSYEGSRRPSTTLSREPSIIHPNQPKTDDQLKLLSSYQNQQRSNYQDSFRGAVSQSQHTDTQQRDLTKLSNRPSQIQPASYLPQSQQDFVNYPATKEQTQINKPRIRNQNEQYPFGHAGDHLGISDDSDFDDDYTASYREVRPRNKVNKKVPSVPDSPVIQEPISTTTLPPTSPKPIEIVSNAPTQSDYSYNYESSDSTQDDEDDIPPSRLFSDEDRFGSRISKSAQPETPFVQQTTLTQAQPSALLSAQLSVQESQSNFPSAALTPTQTPNRIGVGHFQQLPRAPNIDRSNIEFPQSARNNLPQPQAQLQNVPNTQFQQSYNVQQQIPLEQNLPKPDQIQRGTAPYNQQAINQNSNDFRNQYENRPILTQQRPEQTGFLPARQQSGDDLEKKQTEEAPKRQRGRRRKNRQRSSRNRQPTEKTINNEQQTPVKEINVPIPQYQQQQQYGVGQAQYPPQQPLQNIQPNLNNRPGTLSPSLGYPTQNQQSNINPQQSDQSYSRGNSNEPSQYFTRNGAPQLQNNRLPITPNLVSYPEITTKPSNAYSVHQENEPNKHENTPLQSAYGHSQPQQRHPQYNIPPPLNPRSNYQNSSPNNYPSSYNIPTSGNSASSFLSSNAPQAANPSLYRQESVSRQNVGGYRSDLAQQSTYDVSGIQQNQGKGSQQSPLNTEEDKPVPSLSQATTTPAPHQEATTSRSTTRTRSRFGQRRKGRGRSRQQKNRSRNTLKEEVPQGQQEGVHDRGHLQSQPLQQQTPIHDPRTPHINQPIKQQFSPAYNSQGNQQQQLPQNAGYNPQADSKPKQSFLQQAPPPLNSYSGQQLAPPQHNKVPQQYNTPQQSYNNAPQQLPNYHNAQKQLEANLPSNGPSSQVPYTGYGQQQPQIPNVNAPQQSLSNTGNLYPFQPNYGQGPLQAPQSNYQDTIQQNGESQFYKRADAEDAVDEDYAEEGEVDNGEEYEN